MLVNLWKYFLQAIGFIYRKIYRAIQFPIFFLKYKLKNRHNLTTPGNLFDLHHVNVGNHTYGVLEVHMWGDTMEKLVIGDYCSIAYGVKFILGGNHYYKGLSTYPFGIISGLPGAATKERYTNGKIEVGDDVWIGTGATIMSGVTLGQGCLVAAGALVTKDVPPYAIVGGCPAKVISYRFSDDIIQKLLTIDFKNTPIEQFLKHYNEITKENFDVDKICASFPSKK